MKPRTLLVCLALAALAAAPYFADGGRRGFVLLDDDVYISENTAVLGGLSAEGVRWAFGTFQQGNWHPLTWLAHMAVATFAGADPWWHHAAPVVCHALTSALLFLALARLTGAAGRSAVAAALFAVHPLHVESVAWAAELKDALSGFFFVLLLLAYERHARRPRARAMAAVALLLALGLLAKPMLVTAPFVLLLLDWWPLGRCGAPAGAGGVPWSAALREKAPLFALVAASSAVTFAAQRAGGAVVGAVLPSGERLLHAAISWGDYLRAALWPWPLAVYYPYPPAPDPRQLAASGAVLAAATAAVFALRRHGWLATGWLWFLGMLVPVIGIVQIGGQARADRYMHLPIAGLLVAGVWGAAALCARQPWRALVRLAAPAAVAALFTLSVAQVGFWRDSETLFRHALAVTGDNAFIQNNLGAALARSGREAEAVAHFEEALRIQPGSISARRNLGVALAESGRPLESLPHLAAALRADPGATQVRMATARALVQLGRPTEAAGHLETVLVRPAGGEGRLHAEAANQLGVILAGEGRYGEAAARFIEALSHRPDFPEALNNLGNAHAAAGRSADAERSYRAALRLRPDYAGARRNLDALLAAKSAAQPAPPAPGVR